MKKRLHVRLPEQEMPDIQRLAQRERLTVGEWVRRTLRDAREQKSLRDPEVKLRAIRRAAECSFPAAGIAEMLSEIEQGR